MKPLQLGPFLLDEQIGKGGMGHVWRGRHAHRDVAVAVKVVTSERAQKPHAIAAFRDEVHAMARLAHPGIVLVFDTGMVDDTALAYADGALPHGSPWVAMELARLGTLDRVVEGLHWRRLRAILLSILDALAHSHARGLIHRDLKPGNVLLTSDHTGAPRLKLADFGLAQAVAELERDGLRDARISGTPRYMAPEQVEGKWREQGPWTDLYALGCIVHFLVSGDPPYSGKLEDVLRGHLFGEIPPLSSAVDVPAGFEDWTRRLLQKRPRDRFQRAADAAWALLELDDAALTEHVDLFGGAGLSELTEDEWSSIDFSATMTDHPSRPLAPVGSGYSATLVDLTTAFDTARSTRSVPAGPTFDADLPPLPDGWKRRDDTFANTQGVGAGIGLYGLRPVPMTGRDAERNVLWDALSEVWNDNEPRAVMLRGPAGIGKSRLAQWIVERAHEVGAAETFVARHAESGGAADGLVQMLRRHLRAAGLTRDETLERVRDVYFAATGHLDERDVYDCLAITEMLHPTADGEARVRFQRPSERWIVMQRYLQRVARRPTLVWIDDAQWAPEALEFVSYSLAAQPTPTLFVLTVRDEAVASTTGATLVRLAQRSDVRTVDVQRLPPADHQSLVGEMLHLESDLARQVAERTDGNPLFALQLVGDWVQRGVLELGAEGFRLADGEAATIPDDIRAVWTERVNRLVAAFPAAQRDSVRRALEIAAALGQEVDDAEWSRAVAEAGLRLSPLLAARLVERGLAERESGSWRFHHGLLRESLLADIVREGRQATVHGACVAMLRASYGGDRVDVVERVAAHLSAAEAWAEAADALVKAAQMRTVTGDFEQARRWLDQHRDLLDKLGAPDDDPRWGENWSAAASCHLKMNLVDEANRYIEKGWSASQKPGWERLHSEFALHRGNFCRKVGQAEEAEDWYREAMSLFADLEDPKGIGRAAYGVAEVLRFKGHLGESVQLYRAALLQLEGCYPQGIPITLQGMAGALIARGDPAAARDALQKAVTESERFGQRSVMAAVSNVLGELERHEGNWREARAAYARSVEILESIGSRGTILPKLNVALVDLALEDWAGALPVLKRGVVVLAEIGERSHLGLLHVCIAVAAAGLERWALWDEQLDLAEASISESKAVDPDIAHHAAQAAEVARRAGEHERAERAEAIARAQNAAL
jgi:serine/threonine protein kinase/tetratricopeptide (TPR) repeat protein